MEKWNDRRVIIIVTLAGVYGVKIWISRLKLYWDSMKLL